MPLKVTITIFVLFAVLLVTAIAVMDSNLSGRIQDLPTNEHAVISKLRSAGFVVSDTGFSRTFMSVSRISNDCGFHVVEVGITSIPQSTTAVSITDALLELPHLQRAFLPGFSPTEIDRLRKQHRRCKIVASFPRAAT